MKYLPKYTSVGCNQTPESMNWGGRNLVLFAASNSVVIYNPTVCNNTFEILKRKAIYNCYKT